MEEPKALGRLIRRHRKAAGLSMDELAAAATVAKASIGRLELGEVQAPSPAMLTKIARALGAEVEDYFALAGYYTPQGLPNMAPYLRAKYDVSDDFAHEVEAYFNYRLQGQDDDTKAA